MVITKRYHKHYQYICTFFVIWKKFRYFYDNRLVMNKRFSDFYIQKFLSNQRFGDFFSLHRCIHQRTICILAAPVCTTPPVDKIMVHQYSTAPTTVAPVHTAPPNRQKDIAPVQHRTAKYIKDIAPVQHHTAPTISLVHHVWCAPVQHRCSLHHIPEWEDAYNRSEMIPKISEF